ncbi:MAG: hypothetical protein K9J79_05665 [Desulfobacteraceae bacterium]|nr:hypothetical protein [Desulfobacteraceae bacterium]MCF8094834.1 hypothetical protein [Desulfobacteraceae bacterium]
MQTDNDPIDRIADALCVQLSTEDAKKMARLINAALQAENVYTEQIPLSDDDKHDCLLMAFEERILIPVRSIQSGSWEDRVLRFAPEEMFFMPHVARILFENASKTGSLDAESAVRRALSHHPGEHVEESLKFLKEMRPHTKSCMAEGGLMAAVANGAGISVDVHDIVDNCVVAGIMNPCTRGSSMQGLAWYEFHPCLYWDQRFQ